ncbi:ATP-binding protein [Egicoccus sp. AB-alg6-2]|uniref:sensor histidine kinase n=1 Tax=Egicoccus sp. AB-alg6-2 TaxID=3242692 RepID=UPI00359D7B2E
MQQVAATLRDLLLVAYGLLAATALWQYRRRRLAPAGYLAAAFAAIALGLGAGRVAALLTGVPAQVVRLLAVIGVVSFPWLLAAFAWSFEGELPAWLRRAWLGVLAVAALFAVTNPGASVGRDADDIVFLVGFTVAWLVPSIATAGRLFAAGGSTSRIVRARMRLIAGALVLLTAAVVVTVLAPPEGRYGMRAVAYAASLVAAGMAHAGFAPPLPLRLWWRRQGTQTFGEMQQRLISAVTPEDAARAVAPILAGHIGAGVAVLATDGTVLAAVDIDPEDLAEAADRFAEDAPPLPGTQVVPVGNATLVVRMTNYSPLFGDYERELVAAYAWQLQLALERSELAAKHLEARHDAERASRELETTLIGLAHDLRSPAVAVNGYATLLRAADSDEERAHLLEGITASSDYLNGLVDALLELSRIGRTQTEVQPVDLAAVAKGVRERVAVTRPQATIEIGDDLPVVLLNPVRAEQLVDNLVSNAVKHGGRDDLRVQVSSHQTATGFELRVADDGTGIRHEDRDRIFDLFQRGRGAGAAGSGVGLGMVRRIAEHYGGAVDLADTDTGATFVVSFPNEVLLDASVEVGMANEPGSAG